MPQDSASGLQNRDAAKQFRPVIKNGKVIFYNPLEKGNDAQTKHSKRDAAHGSAASRELRGRAEKLGRGAG